MHITILPSCDLCLKCIHTCHKNILTEGILRLIKTSQYDTVNTEKCDNCKECTKTCPHQSIYIREE